MNEGFILFNTYAFGPVAIIPLWRFHIEIATSPKIGYIVEHIKYIDGTTKTGGYFGFGIEGLIGLKIMATENFGIFFNYRIGLIQDVASLMSLRFNNLDGHNLSIGIRF